jgi:mono/diheme cytochrome c family protein
MKSFKYGLTICSATFVIVTLAVVASSPAVGSVVSLTPEDEKPPTIKKIMQLAHKEGLLKKVATGKASDAEKQDLLKYYQAMPNQKPPRGEEKSWAEKTASLIEAAQAAVNNDADAGSKLKSASNCAECHNAHK